jgi:hypothetical protein
MGSPMVDIVAWGSLIIVKLSVCDPSIFIESIQDRHSQYRLFQVSAPHL